MATSNSSSRLLALLLACAVLGITCNTAGVVAARSQRLAGTEISNSVIITGFYDLSPGNNGLSTCEAVVHNSRGFNAKKINFVVTLFAAGEMNKLYRYYYKDQSGNLVAADANTISQFKEGLTKCFKSAVDAGFTTLHILPHVDPRERDVNTGKGLWRNVVKFDPLAKYGPQGGAYSYENVLLQSTAEALNAAINYDTSVEFTLSAEQGRSVWYFPRSYMELLQRTKSVTTRGKDATKHSFGLSFNYDKVCGCVEPEEKDPIKYNNTYVARFERFKAAGGLAAIDVETVKELLAQSDFLGISAYAPLPRPLSPAAMEIPAQTVAFELSAFGIDLKSYLANKQLIYSEQGLGGCSEGGKVASDLVQLRKHPFWGAWPNGGYSSAVDPWQVASYRDYRRNLYRVISNWAAAGGSSSYRIDGVFLWSVGTWDVLGASPVAPWAAGSYADPVIADYIRQGNAVANKLPPGAQQQAQAGKNGR